MGLLSPEPDWASLEAEHFRQIDKMPICLHCGEPMEWDSDYEEFEMDGNISVSIPIYRCGNPECDQSDYELEES